MFIFSWKNIPGKGALCLKFNKISKRKENLCKKYCIAAAKDFAALSARRINYEFAANLNVPKPPANQKEIKQ
jgi:hypothetical protein